MFKSVNVRFLLWFLFDSTTAYFYSSPLDVDPVYLTLSSLNDVSTDHPSLIKRKLQMHWDPEKYKKADLFIRPPEINYNTNFYSKNFSVAEFKSEDFPEGYVETKFWIAPRNLYPGWNRNDNGSRPPGDHCLQPDIVAFADDNIVYGECLRIYPTWMSDNRLSIGYLPISSLFIPGTHNSACYKRSKSLTQKNLAENYLLTQDLDVWSQLVYGIRYLDIRVGIYPTRRQNGSMDIIHENVFWINHDLIKIRPLVPVLREIRDFLEAAPKEVVILDFHRFPVGFNGRHHRHRGLVDTIKREFGDHILPFNGSYPKLNEIWQQNRTLIVSYGDKEEVKENNILWPPVRHLWANAQNETSLFDYLNNAINRKKENKLKETNMWATMGHLTPSPLDLLFNRNNSIRLMAHSVNHNLTKWCKDYWWHKVNIVASDFFLETHLVPIAIAANVRKGNEMYKYYSENKSV